MKVPVYKKATARKLIGFVEISALSEYPLKAANLDKSLGQPLIEASGADEFEVGATSLFEPDISNNQFRFGDF